MSNNVKSANATIDMAWGLVLALGTVAVFGLLPDAAMASGTAGQDQVLSKVLCNIVNWITGTTGKAIATIAIIVVGLGALMGKISWGVALIVAMGVALVFGAAIIVDQLGGTSTGACSTGSIPSGTGR